MTSPVQYSRHSNERTGCGSKGIAADIQLVHTVHLGNEGRGKDQCDDQRNVDGPGEHAEQVLVAKDMSSVVGTHTDHGTMVRENCKEGFDKNLGKNLPPVITKSKIVPADKDWEFIVKMTLIIRDILYGNPRLDEMGWHEEALGRNAVVGGFQASASGQTGCRTLTSPKPSCFHL